MSLSPLRGEEARKVRGVSTVRTGVRRARIDAMPTVSPPARLYAPPSDPPAAMERQLDPTRLGDHLDRLYRAAWALCGSREDAEDLVQETYARVLSRPRLLRREDDLGYL